MHFSVFAKMRKSCENGQIFAKFHEISFRENISFSRKFSRKSREIFAKICAKTKNSDSALHEILISLLFRKSILDNEVSIYWRKKCIKSKWYRFRQALTFSAEGPRHILYNEVSIYWRKKCQFFSNYFLVFWNQRKDTDLLIPVLAYFERKNSDLI
jgi:hypothetical protein